MSHPSFPKLLDFLKIRCRIFFIFFCFYYANCAILSVVYKKGWTGYMGFLIAVIAIAIIAAVVTAAVTATLGGVIGGELEEEEE